MITNINLSDMPVDLATPLNGYAILGEVSTKEINNGYLQVNVPVYYVPSENDNKNGVEKDSVQDLLRQEVGSYEEAKAAGLRGFTGRFLLREEWFEQSFINQLKDLSDGDSAKISYKMNVQNVFRPLLIALGINSTDLDAVRAAKGQIIGFKASASKKEPDKLQLRGFYKGPKV